MNLTLIAAMDRGGAIGRGNAIPWHYPKDFAHFKRETLGSTLIMGRATYESIGRPLPGRATVVLTRDEGWRAPNHPEVLIAHQLEEALSMGEKLGQPLVVAGGAQVYSLALPLASHQILTTVPLLVEDADTFYPDFSEADWREDKRVVEDELVYRWLSRLS